MSSLSAITQWALAQHGIRAALLTSTRAVPNAPVDVLSDYDVILIVEQLAPWVTNHRWLDDFGDVLIVYWDEVFPNAAYGIEECGNVTQYADGLKIDFTLWPVALFEHIVAAPALPDELDAGYQVLVDKDKLTVGMRPPSYTAYHPTLPTEHEYLTWINDFLTDAPYVAKCLWRGELFPAKWCLDVDMNHKYLRQMLEWRVAMEYGKAARIGSLGKGLQKYLPAARWAQVEQCFAGADSAESWAALEHTVAVFRQVALELGEQLGYRYPEELHQRVMDYVGQIKRMLPSI